MNFTFSDLKYFCLSATQQLNRIASLIFVMAVSFSSGHSCRKQWWRRSPNTCCSKKILLLLAWTVFFKFSLYTLIKIHVNILPNVFVTISFLVSRLFAPLMGWLADVKFGRYEMIKSGSLFSFMASILVFFALVTEGTLCKVLVSIALAIVSLSSTCVSVAICCHS